MAPLRIVVLEGDQTEQELLGHSLRLLDPKLVRIEVELDRYYLSLDHHRKTKNAVCEKAAAMREKGYGIKAWWIPPSG